PPVVSAGANQTIELPVNSVTLGGSVSDDGLPAGRAVTVAWNVLSGPGAVTFWNAHAAGTPASFTVARADMLQLDAPHSAFFASGTVTVTVALVTQAPVVSAGANQTIELPTNTVTLNGSVSDDGLPPPGTLTIAWTKVSGSGTVTFSSPNTAVTQATFSVA